ncbi:MAG: iron chelate uptake ABC transporter family permease subunit [Myxococcales bacterium]|nr:iron chelate uptake ABC transporter family permease subunit [Myxococcales bacterium]
MTGSGTARGAFRSRHAVALVVGGLLVLAADQLGQHLLPLSEVPAGLLVAVIGAPYLLYLLMR